MKQLFVNFWVGYGGWQAFSPLHYLDGANTRLNRMEVDCHVWIPLLNHLQFTSSRMNPKEYHQSP